jgi:nitrile hydratase
MNGIHDLGGMDGFGPVESDGGSEEPFRADWEKVAFSMFAQGAFAGLFNLDQFRYAIEKMDPAEYLLTNYYEHWSHVIEHYAPEKGALDLAELERRAQFYLDNPNAELPATTNHEIIDFVNAVLVSGAPCSRESDAAPKFNVGDAVKVVDDQPVGHTRRARYVRGRIGVVTAQRGTFVYPESNVATGDESPTHVYTVKFTADELWGPEFADLNDVVYVDLWEPYIQPAASLARTGA